MPKRRRAVTHYSIALPRFTDVPDRAFLTVVAGERLAETRAGPIAVGGGNSENYGPETGAKNRPVGGGNSENYASETAFHLANAREHRAYSCKPDTVHRDRTAWLGM